MERRATKRFRITLPITVCWANQSGIREAQTESEDISSGGVYFFLPKEMENGSSVEILMVLPHEISRAGKLGVRCHGRVQRTENKELKRVGIAVQIKRYEFLRGKKEDAKRGLFVV